MKICVIGGTGHIGKFLVPMLIEAGHEVTVVTSGKTPMLEKGAWKFVNLITLKYGAPGWTDAIRGLDSEVLVDILQGDSPALYTAVKDTVRHMIVCGSIWMLGFPRVVPTPAITQGPCPFSGYATRYAQLLAVKLQAEADGIAFTAIMPPNICGPYKIPLDCRGGRSIEAHVAHKRGEPVLLPAPGNNPIGPCDAEDVARCFFCAVQNRENAAGQIFNVGAAYALTSIEFVNTYAYIYGVKIPIELVDWNKYEKEIMPDIGAHWHFKAPMCPDIFKAIHLIGYFPKYTPEQSMERAVRWMDDQGLLK